LGRVTEYALVVTEKCPAVDSCENDRILNTVSRKIVSHISVAQATVTQKVSHPPRIPSQRFILVISHNAILPYGQVLGQDSERNKGFYWGPKGVPLDMTRYGAHK
jgi:hypothetical protein